MKKLFILLLITLSTGYISCKKSSPQPSEPFTPVSFVETEYKYLGSYDTLGRPLNLLTPDSLSNELFSFIRSSLPEAQNISKTNPSLLSSNSDLKIDTKSDVYITFVTEGASQLNTLAFYTYASSSPPKKAADLKEIKYLFPNASLSGLGGGALIPGDKIKIGTFDPGTSIGFVLLENGWDNLTKKVNSKGLHFCSNEILNPENDPALKKHTVLINYPEENKILIGFEDILRTEPSCDHDFNDMVIYATMETL